jgi:AhpD family alkylhydroperoxidase
METRLDAAKASPEAYKAMLAVQGYVNNCGLEVTILELVKLRASQINGCAFCLAMHTRDARRHGISDERMHLLNAWRETPLYSAREQAALAWTEALTLITQGHAPDEVYAQARAQFSDKELVDLTLAITTINAWNRLAIGFRKAPEVSSQARQE